MIVIALDSESKLATELALWLVATVVVTSSVTSFTTHLIATLVSIALLTVVEQAPLPLPCCNLVRDLIYDPCCCHSGFCCFVDCYWTELHFLLPCELCVTKFIVGKVQSILMGVFLSSLVLKLIRIASTSLREYGTSLKVTVMTVGSYSLPKPTSLYKI